MFVKLISVLLITLAATSFSTSFGQAQENSARFKSPRSSSPRVLFPAEDAAFSGIRSGPSRGTRFTAENFIKRSKNVFMLESTPAENQGAHGFCHLFGELSSLEDYLGRAQGREIHLSQMWVGRKWLELQLVAIANDPAHIKDLHEGGWSFVTGRIIDFFGIVPEEAYPYPLKDGITASINPNFAALKTKIWAERQALIQGKTTPQQFLAKTISILNSSYGEPPKTFYSKLDGQLHTPESFRDKFLPFGSKSVERMTEAMFDKSNLETSAEHLKPLLEGREPSLAQRLLLPQNVTAGALDEILLRIKQDLSLGYNPTVSILVLDQALKVKPGMFTTYGMNKDLGIDSSVQLTKEMILGDAESLKIGGHLMMVKGYITDKNGNPKHLIVKNSWSGVNGYKGDFVITYDYLEKFLMAADVLSMEGLEVLKKEAAENPLLNQSPFFQVAANDKAFFEMREKSLVQLEEWIKAQDDLTASQFMEYVNKEILDKYPKELRPTIAEHLSGTIERTLKEIEATQLEKQIREAAKEVVKK